MSADQQHIHSRAKTTQNTRVTFRLPQPLLETVEDQVDAGRYPNRSEAFREAVREHFPEGCGSQ